jgi:hypothetical protein
MSRYASALRSDRVNAQFHFMAALCHSPLGRIDEAMADYLDYLVVLAVQ